MSARVVVVGAGPGGVRAAARLASAAGDDVDVTLVSRDRQAWHLAATVPVALGELALDEARAPVAVAGVRCLAGEVIGVTGGGVTLADGSQLAADAVVVACGLDLETELPDWEHACAAWDPPGAAAAAPRLDAVPGGRLAIVVCGLPYRCPPAPFGLAMALADRHRRFGRFTEVCVVTPERLPLAAVGGDAPAFLIESCRGAGVVLELGFEVDLDASDDELLRSADGRELRYELALLIAPHRRSPALAGFDGDGPLVAVDERGATGIEGVWVVGDAAATPYPRAAGVAAAQGESAADAVLAFLGLAPDAPPQRPQPACFVRHGGAAWSRIGLRYPDDGGGQPQVEIVQPTPDLAHAVAGERARFLAAASGEKFS